MTGDGAPPLGVYEKALDHGRGWGSTLTQARSAGFDFVEMSLDDDEGRLARLAWSAPERRGIRRAALDEGVPVRSITLSAHRRYPLGSADPGRRARGRELLAATIDLAADLGVELVQIAGYYAFEEPRDGGERARFVEALAAGAERAKQCGVGLGLENMDGEDVVSIDDALRVLDDVGSPALRLYPDLGNLAANGLDVCAQLARARPALCYVQLKDTRIGEFRRVPFGGGIVPFREAFALLATGGFRGPYVIEMWNDAHGSPARVAAAAREWIAGQMRAAVAA